jgi:dynein heavy chain 1, cytosolic
VYEALEPLQEPEDLVRLYVHEGLRLFEDRLVYQHEKDWCNTAIDACAKRWFPGVNLQKALERPIYFTTYLNKDYVSVGQEQLMEFVERRLKDF